MWDSSCVSRSSLRGMLSILLSPNNFFANCPVKGSVVLTCRNRSEGPAEPSLGDLLLRLRENRDHYLDNYQSERNLSIGIETFEEIPDATRKASSRRACVVARA